MGCSLAVIFIYFEKQKHCTLSDQICEIAANSYCWLLIIYQAVQSLILKTII